jgi:hypothetical protein
MEVHLGVRWAQSLRSFRDGKLVLRGEREDRAGRSLAPPSNIPCEMFADDAHCEPSGDVIEMHVVLDVTLTASAILDFDASDLMYEIDRLSVYPQRQITIHAS